MRAIGLALALSLATGCAARPSLERMAQSSRPADTIETYYGTYSDSPRESWGDLPEFSLFWLICDPVGRPQFDNAGHTTTLEPHDGARHKVTLRDGDGRIVESRIVELDFESGYMYAERHAQCSFYFLVNIWGQTVVAIGLNEDNGMRTFRSVAGVGYLVIVPFMSVAEDGFFQASYERIK